MLRSLELEKRAFAPAKAFALKFGRPCTAAALLTLTMHARMLGEASPLAAAMMGAALASGIHPAAVAGGCLLGMARPSFAEIPLMSAFSCLLLLAMELLASLLPGLRKRLNTACRAAFFSGVACMLPAMARFGTDAAGALQAFACGALAAASAPFFCAAFWVKANCRRLAPEEKTGCALALLGCIAGLRRLSGPLGEIFTLLCALMLPGFAPGAGVIGGLGLWLGGGDSAAAFSMSLCGLVCSEKFLKERWQRALAVCFAALATRMMLSGGLDLRWALCAAAVYPLLPPALTSPLEEISAPAHAPDCDPERIARETLRENRRRLNALADAFSLMAECSPASPDVPDEQELIQQMRSRLCAGCINYGACWAGEDNRAVRLLCSLIGQALERTDAPPGMRILFSDGEVPPDVLRVCRRGRMIPDRLGLLLRDFAQKRRSEIKRCENDQVLRLQLMQAEQILRGMAQEDELPGDSQRLLAALENEGMGFCRALPLPRGAFALMKSDDWQRDEIRRACSALSRRLNVRFLPRPDGNTLRLAPSPRLSAEAAASCQSGVAGEICGDSHIVRMLDESRLLLAISDGMGSGEIAARESGEALRLLGCFLDAGISRTLALETVNRQLLLGSSEDLFATMDLCIIDLNSGVAEMTKLAACRTLILRGGEILRIDGGRLPLGILENMQAHTTRLRLRPGDMVVMGSDGVMEAGDISMAERFLRRQAALEPDQLAEQLVREAAICREHLHRDDLTCICARICSG